MREPASSIIIGTKRPIRMRDFITINLGKNPKKGGIPPRDRKRENIRAADEGGRVIALREDFSELEDKLVIKIIKGRRLRI